MLLKILLTISFTNVTQNLIYERYSKLVIHNRYSKSVVNKRYSKLVIYKRYSKLVLRATRGYDLTSEPQTLEAELPLS